MPLTRSCTFYEQEVASKQTICVICCDEITPDQKQNGGQITLSCCTHVFHGQCFVQHLCHNIDNPWCPTCRADPTEDMNEEEEEEEGEDGYVNISFRQAMKLAKADKKDVATQKSMNCIKKWRRTKKDEMASLKEIDRILIPKKKLIDRQAELYEDKLYNEFEFKYAKEKYAKKEHHKNIRKAETIIFGIRKRVARKYGCMRIGRLS